MSVGRLADQYYELKINLNVGRKPSAFAAFDNGYYCTFGGHGPMFEHYVETGQLGNYCGENIIPKFPGTPNYRKSLLRFAAFDQCFNFLNSDVDDRE